MTFSILDYMIGLLLLGAMIHIASSRIGIHFPTIFGSTPKINLIYGIIVAIIAIELYIYKYGLMATINNSLLMGLIDMLLAYSIFGRWLHNKLEKFISRTT